MAGNGRVMKLNRKSVISYNRSKVKVARLKQFMKEGEDKMLETKNYQFWFCTGSQDLYGDECLAHVAEHSQKIVEELNASGNLPYEVVWKPTLITNELIRKTFNEANMDENCAGVITWMHTFSPAKSWILGLQEYSCLLYTSSRGDTLRLVYLWVGRAAQAGGRAYPPDFLSLSAQFGGRNPAGGQAGD